MKTLSGLDAVIKHTDLVYYFGVIDGKHPAIWSKATGICLEPKNYASSFNLVLEQKPKYQLPNQTNRHYKFAAYCMSIGYPDIDAGKLNHLFEFSLMDCIPSWCEKTNYRIANDPHHELRRQWIDSDFTLPIEIYLCGKWIFLSKPDFSKGFLYRTTQKPLWHDYIKQGYDIYGTHGNNRCFHHCGDKIYNLFEPIRTTDGKYLIGFKNGNAHILPVERINTHLASNQS